MIETTYRINRDFNTVKSSFADINGVLLQKLLPFGWGLEKFKGLRRRAVLRIWAGSHLYKFKVAMYSSTKQKYYLHIVNADDGPFGIKFFSNRITVVDKNDYTEIRESLEFTTKNKSTDRILSLFINIYYFNKRLKYKLFFMNK
tara:strand:- start:156 stop:587 length:432 start_codon:yes stop_codon:yes gene_type:complete